LPNGLRIACVDDDVAVCNATVTFLKSHGFSADAFLSAEAFIRSLNPKDRWCLVTDVRLPGMSGLQLQSWIIDSGFDIPIIFITAFADEVTRSRGMAAGAVCFLTKPVTQEVLLSCIDRARAGASERKI
jgi:FixJ family two-component response regulator